MIRVLGRPSARVVAVVFAVVTTAFVAAVAGAATSARNEIDRITWAMPAQIRGLEYTHSADGVTATVVSLGCETLVQYDKSGKLRPALARSFSNPNPTTYVYRIRPGVKFWDGSKLTAADVIYSLQRAADEKGGSQIAAFFAGVKSMTAKGDTVTIMLKAPDPAFQYTPAVTYILQKRYWLSHAKTIGTSAGLTMCTGPYQFTKYVPDETVEAKRFNGYWGRKPEVANVTIKFIVSDSTRLLAMRSGQIDGTFRIPHDQIDQWKRLSGVDVRVAAPQETAYLSFDVASPPWNDVHVRRAVAYALDKQGLVRAVLRGYGQPAAALPPPVQWVNLMSASGVARLYKSLPQYRYDLAKAKAELALSRYKNGFTATLPYPDSRQLLGKAALALSQSLKQIGINLKVKQISTDAWFNILYNHPKPMGLQIVSWDVDYPDPADAAHYLFDSKFATKNSFNTANYRNAQMDRLLVKQQRATSKSARAAAMSGVVRLAARDLAYLPIWYQQVAMAISDKYAYRDFGIWYPYSSWASNIVSR